MEGVSRPRPRGDVGGFGSGRGVSRPTSGGCIPACTEADVPQHTATAAGGTHPTGMHSCSHMCCYDMIIIHDVSYGKDYQGPHLHDNYIMQLFKVKFSFAVFLEIEDELPRLHVLKSQKKETRIHSSRMRTVRSSSRLLEGGCLPRGYLSMH